MLESLLPVLNAMQELMTLKEIEFEFGDQWVLIADPQTTDSLEITGGTVLHHSPDRDQVYRKAVELRPKRYAVLFTGEMPANTAIVL